MAIFDFNDERGSKRHCETGLDFPLLEYNWSDWSEFVEDSYHEYSNKIDGLQ
jgi:hypothetical protein